MSADAPSSHRRGPFPGRRGPWSLRGRLLLGLTLLVAAIAVTNGVLTVTASHSQLIARLDQQLIGAAERTRMVFDRAPGDRPPRDQPPRPVTEFLPGQGAGAIGLLVVEGKTLSAGYVADDGTAHDFSDKQLDALLALDAAHTAVTIDLGGDLGDYRVIRTEADRGRVVAVNGLSLRDVEQTTASLIANTALVSAAGLLLAVLLGWLIIRVAIRPLDRVAGIATRVSQHPMESKVSVPERVPAADTSPRTEVGRVGLALNDLLNSVEQALVARDAGEQKLRRFISDASHELRTPLAVIRGYTDLAEGDAIDVPEPLRRPLQRIGAESVRMTSMVEDLLLLARLDEGRELRREPTAVAAVLADAVADAHVAGPEHVWQLDLPEHMLEVEVDADPERLHQVFSNLLGNARTHTPAGTRVQVRMQADASTATVEVIDDGPGIPADALPDLFERFTRVDHSRTRDTGGAGLGLAIVRAIVEAHGGTVEVQSESGRTCFRVLLPRSAASA
ncbi:ATP-binding protein [Microbacterium sp. ARD32]|uniref:sensor histidine kinase n=1 Tax=Microbacterium sp. ARD32 TaxID=2962577 RepID=UPI002882CEC5|nr:ATP-binding protein [Microbacterium sp. ARD32]MDT0156223.1 ATP-binding protein [Microbacterium sp. ARD32]